MKILKWTLIPIAALILLCVPILAIENLSDDPLLPATRAAVEQKFPIREQGQRAFNYLLGLRMGAEESAEARGAEAPAKSETLPNNSTEIWPSLNFPLDQNKENLSEVWPKHPEWAHALATARPAIAQYLRLLEYGDMANPPPSIPSGPEVGVPQLILKGHRLLFLSLVEMASVPKPDWFEIEKRVRLDSRFQQSAFNGGTLLAVIIANLAITENARFLYNESQLHPNLHFSEATLSTLKLIPAKEMIDGALTRELQFLAAVMSAHREELSDFYFAAPKGLTKLMNNRLMLRPNESVNEYYEYTQEVKALDCPHQTCFQSLAWTHPHWPWEWFHNPLGRLALGVMTDHLDRRIERLRSLEKERGAALSALQ